MHILARNLILEPLAAHWFRNKIYQSFAAKLFFIEQI